MKLRSAATSLTLFAIALAISSSSVHAVEFIDIYRAAVKLESTGKALSQVSTESITPDVSDSERRITKVFLKPVKSELIGKHNLKVEAMISDIGSKTLAIYHSIMNNENVIGPMKRAMWLNNIRDYSRFDSEIAGYAEGLNYKIEKKELRPEEIDCAMDNLKSRHQQVAMFVLLTDIKNLILNEVGVVNDAILTQLKESKFKANNDFNNIQTLNEAQTKALTQFYTTFRDPQLADTEDFIDHVLQPGQLVIGRVVDSCSTVMNIYEQWKRTLIRQASCPSNVAIFKTKFLPDDKVELMHSLCSVMIAV